MVARSWPEENYPPEYWAAYKARGSIRQQVEALRKIVPGLDAVWAFEHGQDWYGSLKVPEWAEGPLVYVWWEFFGSYQEAAQQVLTLIEANPKAYQYKSGRPKMWRIQQVERTEMMERALKANQPGDVLIVPSQAGKRHRNRSPRSTESHFENQEFGLGVVAEGCRVLLFPERYVRLEQLYINCVGDQSIDDKYECVPCFLLEGNWAGLGNILKDEADPCYGSASGYQPPC